jgi:hypothetical protein
MEQVDGAEPMEPKFDETAAADLAEFEEQRRLLAFKHDKIHSRVYQNIDLRLRTLSFGNRVLIVLLFLQRSLETPSLPGCIAGPSGRYGDRFDS